MKTLRLLAAVLLAGLCAAAPVFAQDSGFGFGDETDKAAVPALAISGTVGVGSTVYVDDLASFGSIDLGDLASASLGLKASGSLASASLNLRLSRARFESDPASVLDAAKVGLFLGPVSLESGLLKLSWGRVDSGPLDILNPLDLTDLSVTNNLDRKLAVPMVYGRLSIGQYSNLEAVFEPGFRGDAIALSGRWEPAAIKALVAGGYGVTADSVATALAPQWTLGRSQAGVRFTTSFGGVDLGAQYHYGYLRDPVIYASTRGTTTVTYDRRHQVGLDFAAVLAGFSLRGEAAANLTADLAGTDPAVPNSALAFSFGFSRGLIADFAWDLQYAGSLRLADGGISRVDDVEYGADLLSSELTGTLSKTFLKGALTLNFAATWGLEDADYLLAPSAVLNFGDGEMGLYGGFYGGSATGKLGQYADASYLKAGITYKF